METFVLIYPILYAKSRYYFKALPKIAFSSFTDTPPPGLPCSLSHVSPDGRGRSRACWYTVSSFCLSTFTRFRLYSGMLHWISALNNLARPSGLICSFYSHIRDFPSNFLFYGSIPSRSSFAPHAPPLQGKHFVFS